MKLFPKNRVIDRNSIQAWRKFEKEYIKRNTKSIKEKYRRGTFKKDTYKDTYREKPIALPPFNFISLL
ncbi:hypothetical protein CQA62_03810 [Helicobacter cholecystus]|uniref:Uncharacterized protein n=1 Tax=Helicobacter cholecystus TaxID=45498 RepID=A0A3D8IW71_9HELI|nr:hypothetical protein CQA62_03810 [Helicobacter cholecystus]